MSTKYEDVLYIRRLLFKHIEMKDIEPTIYDFMRFLNFTKHKDYVLLPSGEVGIITQDEGSEEDYYYTRILRVDKTNLKFDFNNVLIENQSDDVLYYMKNLIEFGKC